MAGPSSSAAAVAAALPAVLAARDPAAFEHLLHDGVRWGGEEETPETCRSRAQVGAYYAALLAQGVHLDVVDVHTRGEQVLARLRVTRPGELGAAAEHAERRVVLSVHDGLVVDILEPDGAE